MAGPGTIQSSSTNDQMEWKLYVSEQFPEIHLEGLNTIVLTLTLLYQISCYKILVHNIMVSINLNFSRRGSFSMKHYPVLIVLLEDNL